MLRSSAFGGGLGEKQEIQTATVSLFFSFVVLFFSRFLVVLRGGSPLLCGCFSGFFCGCNSASSSLHCCFGGRIVYAKSMKVS